MGKIIQVLSPKRDVMFLAIHPYPRRGFNWISIHDQSTTFSELADEATRITVVRILDGGRRRLQVGANKIERPIQAAEDGEPPIGVSSFQIRRH